MPEEKKVQSSLSSNIEGREEFLPGSLDLSGLALSDLIDKGKVQQMLDGFCRLVPVSTAIVDLEGNVIAGAEWQDICTCFHRTNPETFENCIVSDTRLTESIEPGTIAMYRCKNGMWDVAAPIMVDGKKLGNLFMGQFFLQDEDIDRDFFREQAGRYGFNEDEYMAALEKVPRFPRDFIDNAMSFLISIAGYISRQGLANLRLILAIEKNRKLLNELEARKAIQDLAGKLADLGWWVVDLDSNICTWSDEVARIHEMPEGFTPTVEEGISFYAPEYRKRIAEVFGKCAKEGIPYDEELQVLSGSGRRIWVRTMGVPERDAKGEIIRVLGGFQDIHAHKMAEEALRKSENQFRALVEGAPDAIYVHMDGKFVYLNETALRMYGAKSPEEMLGRPILDLFHPSIHDAVRKRLHALYVERKLVPSMEQVHFRLDGGHMPVEVTPILTQYDGKEAVLVFARDITERKKVEEALRDSEERLRSVFENATIGLYRTSPDGKILMANPALVNMLGYSSFEELAKRDLSKDGFESGYPREIFQQRLEIEGEATGLESAWARQDGTTLFVRESARVVRGHDEGVHYYEGTVEDITERKKAEDALRKSEEKYRHITENMSDVVWTTDLDMNTTYVSPSVQKLLGETPEEHMKRPLEEKLSREDSEKLRSALDEELERERSGNAPRDRSRIVEIQHYRADGYPIWISMNISFIRDEDGNPVGFQGVTRDISERRRLEAEYGTLFHEMLDAFALHEIICDADGNPVDYRFITANPAFEGMTGLSLEDLKGRTVLEVLPETERYWIDKYGHVALEGEPAFFENYSANLGKYFEVKAFSPIKGQFATIFTDITERRNAEEKLRRALERTIQVLTQTVERRDPYTAGHQRRVAGLAAMISREMGMDPDLVEQIRISGYVHDLGKISVPAEILSKPGRLSELEMNIIREHPAHGYEILQDVESGWNLAEVVYQHHERLDGSGYPRGLKGEEIRLEARILAVADVVEAMASYRPYRPAIGIEEALKEIEINSGNLYDPQVVRVCLELFREKGYQLEE